MSIENIRASLRGSTSLRGIRRMTAEADSAAEIRALIAEVTRKIDAQNAAFDTFKAANDAKIKDLVHTEKVDRINADITKLGADIDALNTTLAALQLNGTAVPGTARRTPEQVAHAKAFGAYFRRGVDDNLGDLQVKAALTTSSDPDGGYTVPVEIDYNITRILQKISAMRSIAQVMTISGVAYRKFISQGGATAGWVGEQSARPGTNTPALVGKDFTTHELYAMPAASQTLLDDSTVDIGQWLSDEVSITFAETEGLAFISGDGATQPFGLLSYPQLIDNGAGVKWGNLGYVKTGAAADFNTAANPANCMIDLMATLKTGYQTNANYLMNRFVQAEIRKFVDGQGRYLWEPSMQVGAPPTIFGKPIVTDDNMPNAGGGNIIMAYGDFRRGYLIVDRICVRVLRDPYTSKPNILFYTTKRVGGGVQNFEAIKLLKCSA